MRTHRLAASAALAAAAIAAAGCGKAAQSGGTSTTASAADSAQLSPTTPRAAGPADSATWAVYRPVQTIDPIQAFDYPDNTAVTLLCDSLLRQQPDGAITPGVAEVTMPDTRHLVIDVDPKAVFWNGDAVTPEDVVYSLKRNLDPRIAGFYGPAFTRVDTIEQSGPGQVTVTFRKPDMWLRGELAAMPGVVLQKSFVESRGAKFGTASGGMMCSGAYRLGSWKPGAELTGVANDAYWRPEYAAQTREIVLKGVGSDAALTSGLVTNEISATYQPPFTTIDQLKASRTVTVTNGPSMTTDALVISSVRGVLGDEKVRQALSLAIDRNAYIQSLYKGLATLPRTLANPGTWGYGRAAFQADWERQPEPKVDLAKAKELIRAAGAEGKTLTIGMTEEIGLISTMATAIRSAGESIGLKVAFKATSAPNFINFFIDPKAREGVDGFPTGNYPDYADPATFYSTFVLADGTQNYSGWTDPEVTALMERARGTLDDDARAELIARVGDRLNEHLPWIPLALPNQVLVTDAKLTGAPASFTFMNGPWAWSLGSKDAG